MHEFLTIAVEVGCYWVVRLLLPIVSFGRMKVQTLESRETGFNRAGLKRMRDGTLLLRERLATLIGVALWLIAVVVYFAAIHR